MTCVYSLMNSSRRVRASAALWPSSCWLRYSNLYVHDCMYMTVCTCT